MKTKIFCDSADYETIKFFNKEKIVSGFTTNPSLIRLAGAKDYKDHCLKLLKICKKKPISFEVFADDEDNVIKQALLINDWGRNVYVKIPVVNSRGRFMGKVIKNLNNKGVKLNITAVYSYHQVNKIIKCLDFKTKSIISIFAGRLADKGSDPIPVFKKSLLKIKKKKNIEILWASTREAYNYLQANQLGCQIITMPPKIINLLLNFKKSIKNLSIETVKGFLRDSKKSKFKI